MGLNSVLACSCFGHVCAQVHVLCTLTPNAKYVSHTGPLAKNKLEENDVRICVETPGRGMRVSFSKENRDSCPSLLLVVFFK
jgi:hypothetical protein